MWRSAEMVMLPSFVNGVIMTMMVQGLFPTLIYMPGLVSWSFIYICLSETSLILHRWTVTVEVMTGNDYASFDCNSCPVASA